MRRVGPSSLSGYSRALYSNWLWHQPLQLLVDAGEGRHARAGNERLQPVRRRHHPRSFGSRARAAWFGGRSPLRQGRAGEALDRALSGRTRRASKPCAEHRRLLAGRRLPGHLDSATSGGQHPLGGKRTLEAFAVTHVPPEPALGYRVLESRRRLKPEYASLPRPRSNASRAPGAATTSWRRCPGRLRAFWRRNADGRVTDPAAPICSCTTPRFSGPLTAESRFTPRPMRSSRLRAMPASARSS